jgi:hypothetical protein
MKKICCPECKSNNITGYKYEGNREKSCNNCGFTMFAETKEEVDSLWYNYRFYPKKKTIYSFKVKIVKTNEYIVEISGENKELAYLALEEICKDKKNLCSNLIHSVSRLKCDNKISISI